MFFDKEQWSVIGDALPQVCCGVIDNTVLVCPYVGAKYKVCIRVPSGMFSFIKDVLKLDANSLKTHPVKFFLEEESPGEWCFIIGTLAMSEALALWPYRGLPSWAVKGRCL